MKRPTEAITREIAHAIKAGIPFETACKYVLGSKWSMAVEWLMIAEKQHPTIVFVSKAHKKFHDEVIKAEATAEMRNAANLQRSGSPRFALEWLRRRHPQRWAAPKSGDTNISVTVPIITKTGERIELPEDMARQIAALKAEPYTDPRSLPAAANDDHPDAKEQPAIEPEVVHPLLIPSRVIDVTPPEPVA